MRTNSTCVESNGSEMQQETGVLVARVSWAEEERALSRLRRQIFVVEQGVPEELEWDGLDQQAWHFLARDSDGEAIGVARLLPSGQIGRMAVLPCWRGRGVGRALLNAALSEARRAGRADIFLHAQLSAVGFYERCGFERLGNPFEEAGIPHCTMRPVGDLVAPGD